MDLDKNLDELVSTLGAFRALLPMVRQTGQVVREGLLRGNKLLTCGNGGSAADALHLAEELVGRYERDRRAWPAISLAADPTALTCIGNDFGFDFIFSRQIEALGGRGDILAVFSTSGNSMNLVHALQTARERGLQTIALLGKTGGRCKDLAQHEIIVPSTNGARGQEIHTFILHSWLSLIEAENP
jgi:D-sedoheptulose 7-phosphate isomerase